MNGHEWCHETICRVLFFPESYATSQSACSEGLLGRDLQRRQRQSERKTSHLKSLWAFQTFLIEIISTRLKRQIYVSFLELNFWDRTQSWERERKICHGVVTSSIKLSVREFHVTKCATSRAKFFFLPISRCRRRRRWKSSLVQSGFPALIMQENIFFWPYNKSFIGQACPVKITGYTGQVRITILWTETKSRST